MGKLLDLSDFDTVKASESGIKFNVLHPKTKEELVYDGKPVWISLLGPDSEKYKKENNKIINGRIKSNRKGGTITTEVIEQDNKKLVSMVITGWSDNFGIDGEPLTFSLENAKMLLDAYPWIYDQLNDFLGDRGNFLQS